MVIAGRGAQAAPDDSGLGSIYLTVGRLVWVQLKGTVPLQSSPSIGSSGSFDWGGSLLTSNRFRNVLLFAEVGYLSLGDPVGIVYNGQYSAAVSLSWHPVRLPVYPVASLVGASAAVDGDSGYGEWAVGLGAVLGRRTGLSALYSQGMTAVSPQRGATVVFSRRL